MCYVSVCGKSPRGKITSGAKDLRDKFKDLWAKIHIGGKRLGVKDWGAKDQGVKKTGGGGASVCLAKDLEL